MVCLQRCWIGLSFVNLLVRSAVEVRLTLDNLSRHGLELDGLGRSLFQSHPALLLLVSKSQIDHSPPQSMQLKIQRLLMVVRDYFDYSLPRKVQLVQGVTSNTTTARFKGGMVQYSLWVASKDPIWTPTIWRHKDRTDLIT